MAVGDAKLQMTLGQALLLMNASRRLSAFVAMATSPISPDAVATAVRDVLEPAVRDLNQLADQLPRDQFSAALHTPSAWRPDFRRASATRSANGRRSAADPTKRTPHSPHALPE